MYRNIVNYMTRIILMAMIVLMPATMFAAAPLKWQSSLTIKTLGDSMYMPSAISFDEENQRYYVADTGRNRLVSFDKNGNFVKAFTANEQLKSPFDLVRLDSNRLWIVEKGRNSLTFIDLKAKKYEPNILKDDGRLVFPDRIAISGGKLLILDRASGTILRLNDKLAVEQRFGCPECSAGFADFIINNGDVMAIEPNAKKILRFSDDGIIVEEIILGGKIGFPTSFDIDSSGLIYVLDRQQNKVLVYSGNGNFLYNFLRIGQNPGNIYLARQLRFDPWGRLCVVDEGNGRVEIYGR